MPWPLACTLLAIVATTVAQSDNPAAPSSPKRNTAAIAAPVAVAAAVVLVLLALLVRFRKRVPCFKTQAVRAVLPTAGSQQNPIGALPALDQLPGASEPESRDTSTSLPGVRDGPVIEDSSGSVLVHSRVNIVADPMSVTQSNAPHPPPTLSVMTLMQGSRDTVRVADGKLTWDVSTTVLGEGGFATVLLGMNPDTAELVAVKRVDATADNASKEWDAIRREIRLIAPLKHPNIVRYLGSARVGTSMFIVLEYVAGGTLGGLIQRFGHLPCGTGRHLTRQMLRGLAFLHAIPVLHRDIKPRNVLISPDGSAKLADFGLSIDTMHSTNTFRGSLRYAPPDLVEGNLSPLVDVWALGWTVVEMLTGKPPWNDAPVTGVMALINLILRQDPVVPEDGEFANADARAFVLQCLQRDPSKRPTSADLLSHDFVREDSGTYSVRSRQSTGPREPAGRSEA